jgi:hypothetical protein
VRTVVERGIYVSTGYDLTLLPADVTVTLEVHGRARPTTVLPHPKRTYFWDKSYQVKSNEWSLDLTPYGKNVRDGEKAYDTLVYPTAATADFPNM